MVDLLTLDSEKAGRTGTIYFEVPEEDQERARELGAVFDEAAGVWKFTGDWADYLRFFDWMCIGDAVCFALDYIYIIEGKHTCSACGKKTRVFCFGIGDLLQVHEDEPDEWSLEPVVDNKELHLAWVFEESEVPPALLAYIKENYRVKTHDEKSGESCFYNVCRHCGSTISNFDLFYEDSVLNVSPSRLKITRIPIGSSMPLVWDKTYGDFDDEYLKFGRVEELNLLGMDRFIWK